MTRDEVLAMAREAGASGLVTRETAPNGPIVAYRLTEAHLERFAALVAAAERENFYGQDKPHACQNGCPIGQVCDYCQIVAPVQKMIADAVAAQREKDARALDQAAEHARKADPDGYVWRAVAECAAAIRGQV